MLEARAALLASQAYAPVADAVARAALEAVGSRGADRASEPHTPAGDRAGLVPGATSVQAAAGASSADAADAGAGLSVADLGCGTGYYADAVARRLSACRLLVADRSPDAVRMALRTLGGSFDTTGVVLDLWRPLPLRDGAADILLNVFAPRNPSEYARVLASAGALIVVVPTRDHLSGLRERAGMLDIPGGKDLLVIDQFAAAGLGVAGRSRVEYAVEADRTTRSLIAGMGPSAHHLGEKLGSDVASPEVVTVTVSVDVLTLRKPRVPAAMD